MTPALALFSQVAGCKDLAIAPEAAGMVASEEGRQARLVKGST